MNSEPAWLEALRAIHYLTEDQLIEYFHTNLTDTLVYPQVVVHRGAVWLKDGFGNGRQLRHHGLVAEIYCRLSPLKLAWTTPARDRSPASDAVLTDSDGLLIYLEADTGKETERQWQDKLWSYARVDQGRLWVVAEGGPGRLSRLQSWVESSDLAIGWAVTSISRMGAELPVFNRSDAPLGALSGAGSEPPAFSHEYLLDRVVVEPRLAELLLRQGTVRELADERIHHGLIHHLVQDA
jgi:hypothetical protein